MWTLCQCGGTPMLLVGAGVFPPPAHVHRLFCGHRAFPLSLLRWHCCHLLAPLFCSTSFLAYKSPGASCCFQISSPLSLTFKGAHNLVLRSYWDAASGAAASAPSWNMTLIIDIDPLLVLCFVPVNDGQWLTQLRHSRQSFKVKAALLPLSCLPISVPL